MTILLLRHSTSTMAEFDENEISQVPSQRTMTKPDGHHVEDDIDAEAAAVVPPAPDFPAIDPVIEKRVLRKLDKRVPIITGFLCT